MQSSQKLCRLMNGIFLVLSLTEENKGDKQAKCKVQWPTYAATLKIRNENGEWVYQGQLLKNISEAKSLFESCYQEYCMCVTARIHTRLSWSDLQLFSDIIFMLGTQG